MFLVSITHNSILNNFDLANLSLNQRESHFMIHTVITDNFLSKFFVNRGGYSIIETPLLNISSGKRIIYIEINYNQKKREVSVLKTFISGRPIYYHINSRGEFYCSTHISMLKKAGVKIEENVKVLPEFFIYRYIFPPNTLYKNIYQIATGSKLYVSLKNNKSEIERIDQYNFFENETSSSNDSPNDFYFSRAYFTLKSAIEDLIPIKDNVASLLSGGLDSSRSFKYSQNFLDLNESFSTAFPFEKSSDNYEKSYALSAAETFHSKHHLCEFSTDEYLFSLLDAIKLAEVPVHHLQSVLLQFLFKNSLAAKNQVIISGEGADGIFGNSMHNKIYKWNKRKAINKIAYKPIIKNLLSFTSNFFGAGIGYINLLETGKDLEKGIEDCSNILYSAGEFGDKDWIKKYFNIDFNDIIESRYNAIKKYETMSYYNRISMLSMLGGGSATQGIWSKLGEGNHKILYYPYYNEEVVKISFNIPWRIKLAKPKNVLRQVAHKLKIPAFIIERPKSSFGIHPSKWAGSDGVFEPLKTLTYKYFDKSIIKNTQSVCPQMSMIYWSILNYSIWKRIHIDNEPLETLKDELTNSIAEQKF